MEKNEVGPLSYTIHQFNSKQISKVRPESIKLLKENTGEKLHDIELGNFWDMRPKSIGNKSKNRQMELHSILKLLCIKGHNQQSGKATYKMGEKVNFLKYVGDKTTFHCTYHKALSYASWHK